VLPGCVHQPLDLGLGQVLTGAQLAVGGTLGGNCSVYGDWRDQLQVPFGHVFRAPRPDDCSDNSSLSNSLSSRDCRQPNGSLLPSRNPERTVGPYFKKPLKLVGRGITSIR